MKTTFFTLIIGLLFSSCKTNQNILPQIYDGRVKTITTQFIDNPENNQTQEFQYSATTGRVTFTRSELANGDITERYFVRNQENDLLKDSTVTTSSEITTIINNYEIENGRISIVNSLNLGDRSEIEYKYIYNNNNILTKIERWQKLGSANFETGKVTFSIMESNVLEYFESLENGFFENYTLQYGNEPSPEAPSYGLTEFGLEFNPQYYSKNVPVAIVTQYRNQQFKVEIEKNENNRIAKKVTSLLQDGTFKEYEVVNYTYY